MYKIYRHNFYSQKFIIEDYNTSTETSWSFYVNLKSEPFPDKLEVSRSRILIAQTESLEDFFNENPTFEELQINHPELFI